MAGLRAAVGSEHLLWLPGVNAVVIDDRDRVLLGRRADTGEWSLLSGILEPGEHPAHGAAREVEEETGVRVMVQRLAAVTVSEPVRHGNGDRAQYLELVFACRPLDPAAQPHVADDESLEVGWFSPAEFPPMRPRVLELIAHARSGRPQAWFSRPQ
ncbi:NUDIX domain-containing protein [Amycolatopsis sp. NPDC004079]|uniref:NUDIX hydrolase n=1 Tax=Amycolatopsis sp. NPDC004079 TaxID=3154549 RepID=UPI0033ABA779